MATRSKNWITGMSDTWAYFVTIGTIVLATITMIFYLQTYFVSSADLDQSIQKTALVTEIRMKEIIQPYVNETNANLKEMNNHINSIDQNLIKILTVLEVK